MQFQANFGAFLLDINDNFLIVCILVNLMQFQANFVAFVRRLWQFVDQSRTFLANFEHFSWLFS